MCLNVKTRGCPEPLLWYQDLMSEVYEIARRLQPGNFCDILKSWSFNDSNCIEIYLSFAKLDGGYKNQVTNALLQGVVRLIMMIYEEILSHVLVLEPN
jgi:hypothetical protein